VNFLQNSQGSSNDVDEQQAANAHQAMYGSGDPSNQQHDSTSIGAGAAMQALKMFTGSNGGGSDGGMDKNKLIGLAMSQAGKFFDSQTGSGGNVVRCSSSILGWG
jgi:hypothetical protein